MKYLAGISGGLDSTSAVGMLIESGHTVIGATLVMSEHTDVSGAKIAADLLGIEHHIIDCRDIFEQHVCRDFVDTYMSGCTPNPCVVCNRHVKIETLVRMAKELGCDKVITGHYSAVILDEAIGRYSVSRAYDDSKDQSYMLWALTQEQLAMLHLPLSETFKKELRKVGLEKNLPMATTGESMDICFIPDGDYAGFIKNAGVSSPTGDFIDQSGTKLGTHRGIIHYTVGQRKGLGISASEPLYVSKINAENNTITLAPRAELMAETMTVRNLNFQALPPTTSGTYDHLLVKIRYKAAPVAAQVTIEGDTAYVKFSTPVSAITPGQSAVFYDCNAIAFGGVIS